MNLDAKIPAGPLAQKWDAFKAANKLVNPANKRKYDILVVGTGLAGGAAAATLGELGGGAKLFDMLGQERELKASRDKALEFLDSISRNLDTNTEQQYIEKCIRNIIDTQTRKMEEMKETVKALRQDESELTNKIQRRRVELERADKRLKGIENVKPEYQEEYERLEQELDRKSTRLNSSHRT